MSRRCAFKPPRTSAARQPASGVSTIRGQSRDLGPRCRTRGRAAGSRRHRTAAALKLYEAFGDRVAAADAAAEAAASFARVAPTTHPMPQLISHVGWQSNPAPTPWRFGPAQHLRSSPTRQCEVVVMAAAGLSNVEIADELVTSVRTVEGHIFQAA